MQQLRSYDLYKARSLEDDCSNVQISRSDSTRSLFGKEGSFSTSGGALAISSWCRCCP